MAEGITTLADTLLDDLDDLSEGDEEETHEEDNVAPSVEDATSTSTLTEAETTGKTNLYSPLSDLSLQKHLKEIRNRPDKNELIVPTNQCLLKLSQALEEAHLELIATYEPKFPELADLVTDPFHYQQAVSMIENEVDITKVDLSSFLTPNQIITISVAGSTTSGRQLNEEELNRLREIGSIITCIKSHQDELQSFVQVRMKDWAPNTSALLGEALAAKLMGAGGGLQELSKIPACNLQVVGQATKGAASRHVGSSSQESSLLYQSELVQSCPSKFRRKAVKVVAAKVALAIRCDLASGKDSSSGQAFRSAIQEKMQQWQTPDKAPVLKALPKPDLTVKKRRGGKRMRRLKERFEETELMKQANTRAFSAQAGEYGDDAMGLTLGMLDASTDGTGKLRKGAREIKRMRHANTKASRKRQAQMAAAASNKSGLASSMVFTPVQGMELINPQQQNRAAAVEKANRQWFSKNAGFQSALPKDT